MKPRRLKCDCSKLWTAAKVAEFHRSYPCDTAYLLSAGPSVAAFPDGRLAHRLADELVICVKQSYTTAKLRDVADFHVINAENLPVAGYDYELLGDQTIVATSTPDLPLPPDVHRDIELPVVNCGDFGACVAVRGNYDDWLLADRLERPWGPGIMHEVGFFWAVHLGVSRIVTLGFDMVGSRHCYDHAELSDRFKFIDCGVELGRRSRQAIVDSIPGVLAWLNGRGIEWQYVKTSEPTVLEGIVPGIEL